ncbi:Brp/Blh family beta-carotene 15,15'-dioxygenase [Sphingomonas sp. SUN039]|uniref:Brp/Blh family beta-carotene 15,15'-dioxygenase n=1 Tax=Sphingomonas sp. SUN039 TaxID=2937787 RepID=UPI0021643912|nr:Brp/Blh family beta-carotene 15,15'-dioxygenase [Sphingomonas sp. SUN039]UVO52712.1 Brp/Blh family beta-carotene 15,15'-dioxygenase [Sphingomonas sp. SUN039]
MDGYRLNGPAATTMACLALLLFGLPHGSLDISLLNNAARTGVHRTIAVVLLYLGCAATMYFAWRAAPALALGVFLVLACIHFAEDWNDTLPSFFAVGTAVAMLTAPVFLHRAEVGDIYVRLTGVSASAIWMDVGILVAPISLAAALVGIYLADCRAKAVETAMSLLAMILLPPIVGFALFFCLSHSPTQLVAGLTRTKNRSHLRWTLEIAAVTLAALGIAALIFGHRASITASDGAIVASFVTLSILTVPHMLMPHLVSAFDRRRHPIA